MIIVYFIIMFLLCWIIGVIIDNTKVKKLSQKIKDFKECYELICNLYSTPTRENYTKALSFSVKLNSVILNFDISYGNRTRNVNLSELIRVWYSYLISPYKDPQMISSGFSSMESVFIQYISIYENEFEKLSKNNFIQKILIGGTYLINIPINILKELNILSITTSETIKNSFIYKLIVFITGIWATWETWEKIINFIENFQ